MPLNIDTLKSQLTAKIADIDATTDANELLLLVTSVGLATDNRIVAVDTPDDLPELRPSLTTFPFPSGSIFYVRSLGVLVVSSGAKWIGLDGRVLRSEAVPLVTVAWGYNNSGQLGNGTYGYVANPSPVSVVGGITDWTQVSAGRYHTVGITAQGVALAWGRNYRGQLGNGTYGYGANPSPVSVVGGITDWTQVSAGSVHTVGITAQGVALAWGYNNSGQLGNGTYGYGANPSPVSVVGGITNWTQVSAGYSHCVGITAQGVALAWGRNTYGVLGDGTTTVRSSPVSVVGGITDWTQVSTFASFAYHCVGIRGTGVALAWGRNSQGQLGDGATTDRSSPVSVVGGITNWTQVSAGGGHCVGITAQGVALAWGSNTQGQLGNGTSNYSANPSPVSVVGGITNWTQVSAGDRHTVGITAQGVALAWGRNNRGQLGNGATSGYGGANPSPVSVVGGITNWTQVSAGGTHTVGITI